VAELTPNAPPVSAGGVPPKRRRKPYPRGFNRYIQAIYAEENYALEHMDCGLPPDNRVFAIGGSKFGGSDGAGAMDNSYGSRIKQGYLNEDVEAWEPPDTEMESD